MSRVFIVTGLLVKTEIENQIPLHTQRNVHVRGSLEVSIIFWLILTFVVHVGGLSTVKRHSLFEQKWWVE